MNEQTVRPNSGYPYPPFARPQFERQQAPYPVAKPFSADKSYSGEKAYSSENPYSAERAYPTEKSFSTATTYADVPAVLPMPMPVSAFKPLSRAEREEAARAKEQAEFSWTGYQVVHREFMSHKYDPTLTIRQNSITFNNACIARMDGTVYVQLLINPALQKIVIRPCQQDARDAIRWCLEKEDKRKSRQITCRLFAAKLYDLMGWEPTYRYKLQGTKIDYQGEDLYVFDMASTEAWLPQSKELDENGKVKRKSHPPLYPLDWRDSFGLPVDEHAKSMQIDLLADYSVVGAEDGSLEEQDDGNRNVFGEQSEVSANE